MRADQLLVERGIAASRSQAQRLIAAGLRWRVGAGPWKAVGKNGDEVAEGAELELADAAEARYVSRGGLKLEGALRDAGVSADGLVCLDVGQSTGGFTDCLLRHGAARVVGVDVGHGQLHPSLAGDARVDAFEGLNARSLCAADIGDAMPPDGFGLVVGDLSFISLSLVLPALAPLLSSGGTVLMLVKPQFELQPGQVGKGGIVRDAGLYAAVEQRLRKACDDVGLAVRHWLPSAIVGGDGNREFFIHAERAP
ncbi:TlyA family RNA methyltransferase [Xylophilus sp. GOD-11R]|uniref:TlyA family RNA methyltransferase n=1 Tax=Xylophilus sp. GOD-11R TaxID=3089814 RepID=UPI00298C3242|nr:TlyA family RNA methyltransferase [Xylophilus sp. GOD-11R]WPB56343.1 TlyA family RNA methyltransferase [Xylophilus sp. GOD-11R]